jgi:hypothetical protein
VCQSGIFDEIEESCRRLTVSMADPPGETKAELSAI